VGLVTELVRSERCARVGAADSGDSRVATTALGVAMAALLTVGCNMTQLAVSTQAEIMEQAAPVLEEQTDYEFSRIAAPGALIQVDGLLRVSPDNEHLLLLGTRGWASYAYGFIEDNMEIAEANGDLEKADHERDRARAMYLKAKDLGLKLLDTMNSDFSDALGRDPDRLKRFVTEEFSDKSDVPALFWTAYAWGSAINISRDDPELIADLPFPRVLMERAIALDEGYFHAAGQVFMGVINSSLGQAIGGNPEQGRKHFERALQLTQRKATIVQLNYAQTYAVQVQNRKLFDSLLKEIVDAPIPGGTPLALPNTIARRRALRLLAQADNLILPPLDALPASPPEAEGPQEMQDAKPDAPKAPGTEAPQPQEAATPSTPAPAATSPKPPTTSQPPTKTRSTASH